ncbi:MAG: AbrB/MazE/SpoVT family DNA-binding domain-containing protein [Spirochaetales bacterium]|nr:AbrB/MazE/SpoVT family DNA-binding domain-containing protein [Spirochaetales bacterium]
MKVRSRITSKFQVTVPREVREILKLNAADVLEWEMDKSGVKVHAAEKPFLKFKGILNTGSGDTKAEIHLAWKKRSARYHR